MDIPPFLRSERTKGSLRRKSGAPTDVVGTVRAEKILYLFRAGGPPVLVWVVPLKAYRLCRRRRQPPARLFAMTASKRLSRARFLIRSPSYT